MGEALHQLSLSPAPAASDSSAPPEVAVLTRRMVAGDDTAYRMFHDAYVGRLWRYLLVITAGDEDSAREALQSTLLRVARHVKVFSDETAWWSWLTVLARSALSDQTRRRRRYLAFLDRFTHYARVAQLVPDDTQADATLLAALDRTKAALPPDELDLVERKYSTRQPVRQIAEELHTTEKAIESRLVRIRRKLKDAVLTELKHESRD